VVKQIYKEYERAFLLEPTKLTRLVDIIHDRLSEHGRVVQPDQFEVFLSGSRHEEMSSLPDLVALDNSRTQRITRVIITCSASSRGAHAPDYEVRVDFGGPKLIRDGTTTNSNARVISISVRTDDRGWAGRTLSEVEEQVERTWQSFAPPAFAMIGAACLLLLLLFRLPNVTRESASSTANSMWLTPADLDSIRPTLNSSSVITEEQLRAVTTRQLRNMINDRMPRAIKSDKPSSNLLLLVIPVFFVTALVVALVWKGYPREVFLWGDGIERYASVVHWRNILWGLIVAVTIGGVVSQLFYEGIRPIFR
jgi:hypothetical protein